MARIGVDVGGTFTDLILETDGAGGGSARVFVHKVPSTPEDQSLGVIQGVLEERNLIRVDPDHSRETGIDLRRGGTTLLGEGTVTTFVPNPDHIHRTGVPEEP